MTDIALFLIQIITAISTKLQSRWRYVIAFMLTEMLVVVVVFIDGVYSHNFKEHIDLIISLFTTGYGFLLMLGFGLAGVVVVRLLIALKL